MSSNREDKIRQRAHAIWEKEGRPHGAHDRHWQQATSEVDGEAAPSTEPAAATKSPAKTKASDKAEKPAAAKAEQPAVAKARKPAAAKEEKPAAKPRKAAVKA